MKEKTLQNCRIKHYCTECDIFFLYQCVVYLLFCTLLKSGDYYTNGQSPLSVEDISNAAKLVSFPKGKHS